MAIHRLVVEHLPGSDPPQFRVVRGSDTKAGPPVAVPSPNTYPVPGRPNSNLAHELSWYLEWFLDYPFSPETEHAAEVQTALHGWGKEAFSALFNAGPAALFYHDASRDGLAQLLLQVSSDDPQVLAWPWEALEDPAGQTLAHICRLERRLNQQRDPVALPEGLAQDRVNLLLVTARPYEEDVRYRSISRPLVELVKSRRLPVEVTLLRPATLDALRQRLHDQPGYYHVVHFDLHGAYGVPAASGGGALPGGVGTGHVFHGYPQGQLVFEDAQGRPDPQPASTLSALLQEYGIPAVVLNACQSGMIDSQAQDAFASVATALLKAGVRSITAMAYSLYVSAAQQLLPAFYERLFASGEFAEAVRAGRQQMLAHRGRVCARGTYDLDDWLVPVLYQQADLALPFVSARPVAKEAAAPVLPEVDLPYGFIGRDGLILQLERALHRPAPVLLVTGLGGVGKTVLARGFAEWLLDTRGLASGGVFWYDFREIRAAESVVNRIGEAFFGPQFITAPLDARLEALARTLHANRSLIVWDNFEVVWGIAGTSVEPSLDTKDRELLRRFGGLLAGGQTKIMITSRSGEGWLPAPERFKLTVGGLSGEERWEFCESVLRAQGKRIDRSDPELLKLLDFLGGHPLAMRVVLPRLEDQTPAGLIRDLEQRLSAIGPAGEEDPYERQLLATLRLAVDALPADLRGLLVPLSLHERYVDGDYLEAMAKQVSDSWDRAKIDAFLTALCGLGLLTDRGQAIFELHPLVTRYLQSGHAVPTDAADPERWSRTFVDVMATVADSVAPKPLREQRFVFFIHELNFQIGRASCRERV